MVHSKPQSLGRLTIVIGLLQKHSISTQKFQAPRNDFGVKPCAVKPPSIQMVCPVVNEEAGMHRNAITPVIS